MKKTQRSFNSTIRKSGAPKKTNPARRRKNYERTYGGKKRRDFVAQLPCAACGIEGYSVNAHIETGGTGYKAHYTKIIPLCGPYPKYAGLFEMEIGCHALFDEYPWKFTARYPGFDAIKVARETEERWLSSLGSSQGGET